MKNKSTSQPAPSRHSLGEGGFFNLRVLIGVFLVLAGVFLALLGFGTFSNVSAQPNLDPNAQGGSQMKVIRAAHSDLSPPLRDQPLVWPQERQEREPHVHPRLPIEHQDRPDPVIQSSVEQQLMTSLAIPAPARQWAGVSDADCGKPCEGPRRIPMAQLGKLNMSKW